MSQYDQLVSQAELTLAHLLPCHSNTSVSAYEGLFGSPFDFRAHPIGPPGAAIVIHEKPSIRGSWAPHGVDGLYLGPALDHYRCFRVYVKSTAFHRIADTVEWLNDRFRPPTPTAEDLLIGALADFSSTLRACLCHRPAVSDRVHSLADSLLQLTDTFAAPDITSSPPPHPAAPAPDRSASAPPPVQPAVSWPVPRRRRNHAQHHLPTTAAPVPPHSPSVPTPSALLALPPTTVVTTPEQRVVIAPNPAALSSPPATLIDNFLETASEQRVETASEQRMEIVPASSSSAPPPSPGPRSTTHLPAPAASPAPPTAAPNEPIARYPRRHHTAPSRYALSSIALPAANATSSSTSAPIHAPLNLTSDGRPLKYWDVIRGDEAKYWIEANNGKLDRLLVTTKTIRPIHYHDVPYDRRGDATYYNPKPKEKIKNNVKTYRIRGTAGGDRIRYPGPTSAETAAMPLVKLLIQSVVSDGANWMTLDIKDFYLAHDMPRPEYVRIPLRFISDESLNKHKLRPYIHKGAILFEVNKPCMVSHRPAALPSTPLLRIYPPTVTIKQTLACSSVTTRTA